MTKKHSALKILAQKNLLKLKENPYPGRGIIVGLDETGKYLIQVYWIMGRRESSRNRVFKIEENGVLKTEPADPSKVKDDENSDLIYYTAMAQNQTKYSVSNGHQTVDALSETDLEYSLKNWEYEPDAPNYTPRITAVFRPFLSPQMAKISVLKKSPSDNRCDRELYVVPLALPGLGFCVTTYSGDGNPLPSFEGSPYLLPLSGDISGVAQTIWSVLNPENRVSLAVKFLEIKTRKISMEKINKYNAVD